MGLAKSAPLPRRRGWYFCVLPWWRRRDAAKQSDIIRAFGVTPISVKRSVKTYREKGAKGFYAPRVTRGAAVLVDSVVAEAEELLADGAGDAEVAEKLGLKLNTLQKAIRAGRVRRPAKKNRPATLSPRA
jgi:transposase